MEQQEPEFLGKIEKVLYDLTDLIDQIESEKGHDPKKRKCVRLLSKAQNELLKAYFVYSFEKAPDRVETFEHSFAINQTMSELGTTDKKYGFDFGGYKPDVVAKIDNEWVIVEAETNATNCVNKIDKVRKVLEIVDSLGSGSYYNKEDLKLLEEIKGQLNSGKYLRLIFVVTEKPATWTLEDIRKKTYDRIYPEVYHFNIDPNKGKFQLRQY
ncbi:MAG: hypothetical protein H3Z52_07155 [archaeon]|nr:hypothetical protein [archaeon]